MGVRRGSKLEIEIMDDGSIKLVATGMVGTEADILKELESLAAEFGGELVVEKHVHSHSHSHSHDEKQTHKHKH